MRGLAWGDLQFVKVVTFDSAEWRMLSVEARGLFMLLYRAADRSGTILLGPLRREKVGAAVAVLLGGDKGYCTKFVGELLEAEFLNVTDSSGRLSLVIPEFVEAQSARITDKVRAQQLRERRHNDAISSSQPANVLAEPTRNLDVGSNPQRHARRAAITIDQRSEIREERLENLDKRGESEGGQAPKTDPTPTIRKQNFDEALGKGPEAWSMAGNGSAPEVLTHPAKAQNHPTQDSARPSPPAPRPGSAVGMVDPTPASTPPRPVNGILGGAKPLVDPGPTTRQKPGSAKKPPAKVATPPQEAKAMPLPTEWTPSEAHYQQGLQKYGFQKKHVDYFADEMRDHAAQHHRVQLDWEASFRTWMRKGWEFRKGELPNVPDPVVHEPKRPVPPAPPPHPMVVEAIERRMASTEPLDLLSLCKRVGNPFANLEDVPGIL
jgi:hypothetical protein